MKIKAILLSSLAVVSFGVLSADCCYDPCDSFCDPCTGWKVHADYLYWKVRRSDLDYVIDEETSSYPDGTIKCVDVCYDHGFRIGARKSCEDFDVGVRYVFLRSNSNSSSTRNNDELIATRIHPGDPANIDQNDLDFAKSSYDVDIDYVDVELGKSIEVDECMHVRPAFGFTYASIDQRLRTIYEDATEGTTGSKVKESLDMDAYGLYLGGGVRYTFCECFSFISHFSTGIYVADFDAKNVEYNYDNGNQGSKVVDAKKEQWLMVGSYELSVGLGYDLGCYCGVDLGLAVGYEFHKWYCMPDFINFTDDLSHGTLARNNANLGYDGLYVRLAAAF